MSENIMFVPSRLKSSVVGGYVTGTDQIVDDATGKSQAEINAGISQTVVDTVNDVVRESTAINETVDNKIDEKVPQVVAQALNDAVMPAMQEAVQGVQNQVTALQEQVDNLQPGTSTDNNTTYKISLNGEVKGDSDGVDLGTVYAPTTAGTIGKYLKSTGNGAPVWADAPSGEGGSGITQEDVTTIINQTLYGSNEKPQDASPVTTENLENTLSEYLKTGDISSWARAESKPSYDYSEIQNTPTSLPASDVPAWAKENSKPGYGYGEIGYNISKVSSEGGAVTLDATVPVHEITASANISGITFANNTVPEDGHSCHVIVKAAEELSISIADGATMAVENESEENEIQYVSVCPESSDITLNITAGGYVEFDLFRIGENIYIRGI